MPFLPQAVRILQDDTWSYREKVSAYKKIRDEIGVLRDSAAFVQKNENSEAWLDVLEEDFSDLDVVERDTHVNKEFELARGMKMRIGVEGPINENSDF